jgi:hypothetical protein
MIKQTLLLRAMGNVRFATKQTPLGAAFYYHSYYLQKPPVTYARRCCGGKGNCISSREHVVPFKPCVRDQQQALVSKRTLPREWECPSCDCHRLPYSPRFAFRDFALHLPRHFFWYHDVVGEKGMKAKRP